LVKVDPLDQEGNLALMGKMEKLDPKVYKAYQDLLEHLAKRDRLEHQDKMDLQAHLDQLVKGVIQGKMDLMAPLAPQVPQDHQENVDHLVQWVREVSKVSQGQQANLVIQARMARPGYRVSQE